MRVPTSSVLVVTVALVRLCAAPAALHAGCNIIPVAGQFFPSAQAGVRSGAVSSPIAAPGAAVRITVSPACDGLPPGFAFAPTDVVKLRFLSPAPGHPETVVDGESETVDPDDPSGHTLRFTIPDTDASNTGSPDGLAGPARITVERGVQEIARIEALYHPADGCDLAEEHVFKTFTVLPKANDVATQSTAPTRVLMTVDGDGNLLIPFDHTGGTVLPNGAGAPVARLLRGDSTFPAFAGMPVPGLSQALATALTVTVPHATSEELLRSFTIDGRPLPPLLRGDDTGALFGTTDADRSVLRVRRLDGAGGAIYDVTTRLENDVGPIVVSPAFSLTQCQPVPLRGLRSSSNVVAFVRDELGETPNPQLNGASGDTDFGDSVVFIVDPALGGQSCAVGTGEAVSTIDLPGARGPVVETSGRLVAFTESEADQNGLDLDGNGDAEGHVLRVWDAAGTELTATDVAIDLAQRVNDRPLVIADPLVFSRTQPGRLGFVGTQAVGLTPTPLAVSPDGKNVYVVTSSFGGFITTFSRNPTTGALVEIDSDSSGTGGSLGLATSPDGNYVYVSGGFTNAYTFFARDPATGALAFAGERGSGTGFNVAVSPDGTSLYLVDPFFDDLAWYQRNAVTGRAFFRTSFSDGAGGVDGLDGATAVAVSPDDQSVYVTGHDDNGLAHFRRAGDAATGTLTFVGAVFEGTGGVAGMVGPSDVRVSADGLNVYVSCNGADTMVVFSRNPTTGALTYLQTTAAGGNRLTVSPDGRDVYVAATTANAVRVFHRNGASGTLGFVEELVDGVGGVDGLANVGNVAVSPDGLHLYAPGFDDGAIAIFGVSQGKLAVFDADTASFRPEAAVEATEAVVAGLRAGILTPEANVGASLNGDADRDDLVAQVYDGADPTPANRLTSLGVAADRIVASSDVVAVTVPEAHQNAGAASGAVLNDDDDALDAVVFRAALPLSSPATPQNLGVAADALGATGDTLVIVTPESAEGRHGIGCKATKPSGGCDLDGDGDALDRVLRLHRATGFSEVRRPVEDFVVGGDLVAFRSSEAAMSATGPGCLPTSPPGGCDRNGDGDALDAEMMVYDLAADALIPTGQTAIPCRLDIPGCEAHTAYKIKGNNVCFLTSELEQNTPPRDLDGDGQTDGIVLQCFNARSRKLQRFPLCDTTATVDVFPGAFVEGALLNVRVSETALGYDVNGDAVLDDCVLFVGADSDEDDTFDEADTCVEDPNVAQSDSDLDGLGDVCDPNAFCGDFVPAAPPPAPAAAVACQRAIGKIASGYLKQRASAERGCLDKLAKGKLTGEATALCRGSVVGGVDVPPVDPKTGAKIAKAAAKLAAAVAKGCTDPDVAMLATCAATASDLPGCVLAAYAATAGGGAELAYGDVGAIAAKATLACQRAVGDAGRLHLAGVVQAMQQCLDKRNDGKIVGDPQLVCLGSLTPAGVVPPTDPTALAKVQSAEANLRARITKACPTTELQALEVCGGAATTTTSAGNCLACANWRRGVEALRAAYGPTS